MAAAYTISSELKSCMSYNKLFPKLSMREVDVLLLSCSGMTNAEIANEFNISVNTVGAHLKNAMNKYSLESFTSLRAFFYFKYLTALADLLCSTKKPYGHP